MFYGCEKMKKAFSINCDFCGRINHIVNETSFPSYASWKTVIYISKIKNNKIKDMKKISVCPKCREKHTVQELYMLLWRTVK